MVPAARILPVLLAAPAAAPADVACSAHHPCLGLAGRGAYSDSGDQFGMKNDPWPADPQRPPVLEYLEQHGWKILRRSGREEVAGLCPLHRETQPSFYVNRRKNVFYC